MIFQTQHNRPTRLGLACTLALMGLVGTSLSARDSFAQVIERISVDSNGIQGDQWSGLRPSFSADGRYVAFYSEATNLVPGDSNGWGDIFVHDRQTGATERVSVDSQGGQADHTSLNPTISADGRYVAFISSATNLVPGDTNSMPDIFIHDRLTASTERVSSVGGEATNGDHLSWSGNGRYVAFSSSSANLVPNDTNGRRDVFVYDRQTHVTQRVSVSTFGAQGNDDSEESGISYDGRFVVFASKANNLVLGDTNGLEDVFVRDLQTQTTEIVSVTSAGGLGYGINHSVSISADGRYVAFTSWADDLIPIDTNAASDVFVHDRLSGQTQRVSVSSSGAEGNTTAPDPTLSSFDPQISPNGRYVVFSSYADSLVDGDTNGLVDVFVHDRSTGVTELMSESATGEQGDGSSFSSAISGDGQYVAFQSYAANLVPDDDNGVTDIFVRDRGPAALLTNISTRGWVGVGVDVMVGGFVIGGTGSKQVLIRGYGPTLEGAVGSGVLPDPVIELYADHDNNPLTPAILILSNDDWGTQQTACPAPALACGTAQEIIDTGKSAETYAPTDPNRGKEAALLVTLPPGAYPVTLRGSSSATGVGLIAVNEIGGTPMATLANISSRSQVLTGSDVMVGGFIIAGGGPKQVLIRGYGPTLAGAVGPGVLPDPVVELYADDDNDPLTPAVLILSNNDWGIQQAACPAPAVACGTMQDIIDTGKSADAYAPNDPNRGKDAALLVTLPPGAYPVTLRGAGGLTGVGLVSVNEMGP